MKEQFLNLSGLIDLVTYMKLCIAQHKVIIPRASFSLFPETGDENNIYIDTSTNAIYRWNDTDKKFILLAKPPRTIAISEGTNNGEITLKVDNIASNAKVHGLTSTAFTESNKFATAAQGAKADSAVQTITLSSGTKNGTIKIKVNNITTDNIEVAGLGSAAFSDIGIFAAKSHTHKKDEVGLGNVDNTADINKSVKYATSAGSIDWSGIKNKPSVYPPPQDFYDDRFYTKSQVDSKLSSKSDTGHTHVQFIQETKFSNGTYTDPLNGTTMAIKASGGIAADLIYEGGTTLSSKYQAKGSYASNTHTHDDRYYTETEMNSKLAGKAEKSHTHSKSEVGLGNVDNTADANKSVKYAGSSGSSNSIVYTALTNTNLNTLQTEGKWYYAGGGNTCTNIPIESAAFELYVGRNASGWRYQQFTVTSGEIYIRVFDSSNWGNWRKLAFTSDTVASASSVPWSGISGKPSTFPPSSHSHTKSQITDFPGALKNPNSLKIQLNGGTTEGTNQFTYDGSAAKSFNITPSNIGAAAVSHTHSISNIINLQSTLNNKAALNHIHSYLPLSGGTLTGQLKINGTAASVPLTVRGIVGSDGNGNFGELHLQFGANNVIKLGNDAAYSISADGGTYTGKAATAGVADSANAVAWANVSGKPSTYAPSAHTHPYAGSSSTGGSANSAVKLDSSAGSSVQPIYFSGGKPVACTYTLGKSVPSNAVFTDTNTWRGIQNNLTSDSTSDSLSAAQGKVLKGLVDGKAASSHTHTIAQISNLQSTLDGKANNHSHPYLPLSGGTMTGTAFISWADTGNWTNNNNNVTFPVLRGGLKWSGQSDGIELYAVETGNDNLELYLKFLDDNSNGLSIRNSKNEQTARISSTGTITATSFIGSLLGNASSASSVPWSGVTGKPSTFTPSSHTHTKSQITDFPTSMPASDVYAWAKASSKPSYAWSEITGKPSTFTPASHTHNYAGSSSAGGSANWANGATYSNYAIKLQRNPTENKSDDGVYFFQASNDTTKMPNGNWWSLIRTQHPGYANGYWQEIALSFDSDNLAFRRNVNGTKTAWKYVSWSDHTHSDKLGAVSANGFYGMARPDGNTSDWIRTTSNGIIPYQSGGAGSGHCGIGTSSWYFSSIYVDQVRCSNIISAGYITSKATLNVEKSDASEAQVNTSNSVGGGRFVTSGAGRTGIYSTKQTSWLIYMENYNTLARIPNLIQSPGVYKATGSQAANLYITSDGNIRRSTSASKYKLDIQNIQKDDTYAYNLLKLNPRQWFDKYAVENYAEYLTDLANNTVDKTKDYNLISDAATNPYYGLVAEDLEEAGLSEFCDYVTKDGKKELEGIEYDRIPILMIPILRDLVTCMQKILPSVKENIADKSLLSEVKEIQSRFNSFNPQDIVNKTYSN